MSGSIVGRSPSDVGEAMKSEEDEDDEYGQEGEDMDVHSDGKDGVQNDAIDSKLDPEFRNTGLTSE